MRSAGQVVFVSRNGGMIVVHHDDGYAVIELIGDEGTLSVGDRVQGDWDALGGEPLFAGGETLDVYFQGSWGSRDAAVRIARNTGVANASRSLRFASSFEKLLFQRRKRTASGDQKRRSEKILSLVR